MLVNKKLLVTLGLLSIVVFGAMTTSKPQDEGFKNLKVLPKNISGENLHKVMEEWEHSLGVHCNFCHARNEETKKMDWASDAKPEKAMARDMYKMMNKINQKYFHAKKDSLGMIMQSGVNCNTCHRGTAHPEVMVPDGKGPGGQPGPPSAGPAPGSPAPTKP
ncbi:c-type cytochrome [Mucilaginibacter sp. P19]|uniref:Photosynthetic reaction center cytochrome c subunit n=1 Tax=Mucilaginibacter gossypii TaxID=551996 RepID=A0A1G7P0F9_9SPHI|nr:c-type cytochrome [Mucilaginibacter gossypii]SDF79597.1 Photosynthetic reaction center cytochrome C subunit [Mucilaginibacter gossypii]